jgi:hypothetical protein
MKKNRILFFAGLLTQASMISLNAEAQQAWHGSLNSLMSRIPQSNTCAGGYELCDHTADGGKYIIITGLGSGFTDLQKQMMNAVSGVSTGSMPDPGSAPSPEQVEAMKQQAMAKMAAMQNMTPQQAAQMKKTTGSMPTIDADMGREIGQAQTAAARITELVNEMSQKINKVQKTWDSVKMGPNCPEYLYKSLVAPSCACEIKKRSTYETARTAALNPYLLAVSNLAQEYMGRMRPHLQTVDEMTLKTKYGDAITDPSWRQMVVVAQRQAMNGVSAVIAAYGTVAKDGAEQWARQLNSTLNPGGCNP